MAVCEYLGLCVLQKLPTAEIQETEHGLLELNRFLWWRKLEAHKMLLGIAVPWVPCWVSVWSSSLAPGTFSVLCTLLPTAQRGYLKGTAPHAIQVYSSKDMVSAHSSIHWKIFIEHLLWTYSYWKYFQIQILKNHLIEMYNYYFSHQINDLI